MKKLGRNELCHCGSGKKYKKCCLGKSIQSVIPAKNDVSSNTATSHAQNTQGLLTTTTGELHLPVRLYYEVYDKAKLIAALNRLGCVAQAATDRWHLAYEQEAKEFGLSVQYNEVPQSLFPIVLGYIHLVNDELLHIDVRSYQRAARMIEFIDRHVDRKTAKITHAASYTKLMTITEEELAEMNFIHIDAFFMPDKIEEINPELITKEQNKVKEDQDDIDVTFGTVVMKLVDERPRQQQPLIEKFPVHFYEKGIGPFEFSLSVTELLAIKHHQGDKEYSAHDAVIEVAKKVADEYEKKMNAEENAEEAEPVQYV